MATLTAHDHSDTITSTVNRLGLSPDVRVAVVVISRSRPAAHSANGPATQAGREAPSATQGGASQGAFGRRLKAWLSALLPRTRSRSRCS